MKLQTVLYFLLILINLISLYFIITLFGYDGARDYLESEVNLTISFRTFKYILYITSLINLYFLFFLEISKKFRD